MEPFAALVPLVPLVPLVALAGGLFVSTNLDDMFLLVGFLSAPTFKPRQVAIGQFAGLAVLYGASVVASRLALVISPAWVGLLGFVPIAVGIKKLWDLRTPDEADDERPEDSPGARWRGNGVTVAAVTIADGGDNLSAYIPAFATRSGADVAVIGIVFAVMTAAWLGIAFWLTRHRTFGPPVRRYGRWVVPVMLMALGGGILAQAHAIELLERLL